MEFLQIQLLILLLIPSVAFSQKYEDLDTNRDRGLDQKEFAEVSHSSFSEWDKNSDNFLDFKEYLSTYYRGLDENNDLYISKKEWKRGYKNLNEDYLRSENYLKFDEDQSERISRDEFRKGIKITDYYSTLDINGDETIDMNEMNMRIFNIFDENLNDTIDEVEYNNRDKSFYYDFKYLTIPPE